MECVRGARRWSLPLRNAPGGGDGGSLHLVERAAPFRTSPISNAGRAPKRPLAGSSRARLADRRPARNGPSFPSFFRWRPCPAVHDDPHIMTASMTVSASDRALPLLPLPSRDEMERAYLVSDASYDGVFFLGVRTTGIFCRPSCPARKPKPENVEFFAQPKDALGAGYRPCLRCRPLEDEQAPEWAKTLLARLERAPGTRWRDDDLRTLGLEPARVRRYFAGRYGMTFQAYCRALRLGRAFDRLRAGASVDDAVFDVGYESHSGFRDAFARTFGQPPGRSEDTRRVNVMWLDTPLGPMIA